MFLANTDEKTQNSKRNEYLAISGFYNRILKEEVIG